MGLTRVNETENVAVWGGACGRLGGSGGLFAGCWSLVVSHRLTSCEITPLGERVILLAGLAVVSSSL